MSSTISRFLKEIIAADKRSKNCVNALRLSLCDDITDRVSALLADYRIDDEDILCTWVVAQIFKNNPQIKFPAKLHPRLSGILRFFQYKNAEILQKFRETGKMLNENSLAFMPSGGLLLKCLNPDETQYLWSVDFVVTQPNQ